MQGSVQGNEQSMDVEDWQDVQENIIRLPTPGFVKGVEIRNQIAVGDLRAFWPSRCAAGVDDDGGIILGGRALCVETTWESVISNLVCLELFRLDRIKKDTFLQLR